MFCTSLRRRSFDFPSILPKLTTGSTLALRENDLATHDVALYIGPKSGSDTRQLRILLLSPSTVSDSKMASTIERVQHLARLTDGQDIVIAFLISPPIGTHFKSARTLVNPTDDHGTNGMFAYCKLQAGLTSQTELSIPILPLPTLEALPSLLQRYLAAISGPPRKQHPVTTPFELLQHCTVSPPLREQTAFLLSDSFESIRELAEGCCMIHTSATERSSSPPSNSPIFGSNVKEDAVDKLNMLGNMIDPQEWENMAVFWQEEWAIE